MIPASDRAAVAPPETKVTAPAGAASAVGDLGHAGQGQDQVAVTRQPVRGRRVRRDEGQRRLGRRRHVHLGAQTDGSR